MTFPVKKPITMKRSSIKWWFAIFLVVFITSQIIKNRHGKKIPAGYGDTTGFRIDTTDWTGVKITGNTFIISESLLHDTSSLYNFKFNDTCFIPIGGGKIFRNKTIKRNRQWPKKSGYPGGMSMFGGVDDADDGDLKVIEGLYDTSGLRVTVKPDSIYGSLFHYNDTIGLVVDSNFKWWPNIKSVNEPPSYPPFDTVKVFMLVTRDNNEPSVSLPGYEIRKFYDVGIKSTSWRGNGFEYYPIYKHDQWLDITFHPFPLSFIIWDSKERKNIFNQ